MPTPPPALAHQTAALLASGPHEGFAFLLEQGLGKSRVCIDRATQLFKENKIDAMLIVAPNGVHDNWITREFPTHMTLPYRVMIWNSGAVGTRRHDAAWETLLEKNPMSISVLAINIEALVSNTAIKATAKFLRLRRCLFVIDESSTIKTPTIHRTRTCIKLGRMAPYRIIATGTDITEGPLDLYSQFQFIQPGALGFTTFTAFKAYYAQWEDVYTGGKDQRGKPRSHKSLVQYRNLDELKRRAEKIAFRARKKDCLDLPPQLYVVRPVELTNPQRKLYDSVRDQIITELLAERHTITVSHALTRLVRLQQIIGGHYKPDETSSARPIRLPSGGLANAKLNSLHGIIDETPGAIIIWARFVPELELLWAELRREYGTKSCGRWWGDVDNEERQAAVDSFQSGATRFFLGQQGSAGRGLTLTRADKMVYFSNSFSAEQRVQSESRAHRIGSVNPITYIDLVARGTMDEALLGCLRSKREFADIFAGSIEGLIQWMQQQKSS